MSPIDGRPSLHDGGISPLSLSSRSLQWGGLYRQQREVSGKAMCVSSPWRLSQCHLFMPVINLVSKNVIMVFHALEFTPPPPIKILHKFHKLVPAVLYIRYLFRWYGWVHGTSVILSHSLSGDMVVGTWYQCHSLFHFQVIWWWPLGTSVILSLSLSGYIVVGTWYQYHPLSHFQVIWVGKLY